MRKASEIAKSRGRLRLAMALAIGLAWTTTALAGEPAGADRVLAYEESAPVAATGGSSSLLWTSVRTGGSLGLVLAVIGLGVVAVRRLGLRGRWTAQASDGPRVVARTYLGPKESLCVVRVGAEVLLLGVSSQQISMLCKLDPARTAPAPGASWFGETHEAVRAPATAAPARIGRGSQEPGTFQRYLRQLAGEGGLGEVAPEVPAFEGRLQRIRAAWGLGDK